MPRKKVQARQMSGIKLMAPYDPDKINKRRWDACLRNNDLVDILIYGPEKAPGGGLDGFHTFESEKETRQAWETNRALIRSLTPEGQKSWAEENYG